MKRITVGSRILLAKSCAGCGHLRQASQFGRKQMEPYHNSECNFCMKARAEDRRAVRQQSTLPTATQNYVPWDFESVTELISLVERGKTDVEIALIMCRSESAITNKRKRLGMRKR